MRWRQALKQKMAVACFRNNEIVGINILVVRMKGDVPEKSPTKLAGIVKENISPIFFEIECRNYSLMSLFYFSLKV